jgi:nucleotide-binding universal stress UspA family protein
MAPLPKCLLFPIDGTEDTLKPVAFLRSLYRDRDQVGVIVCYFATALPPAYQEQRGSPEQLKTKQEFMRSREQDTRSALDQAKNALVTAGFRSDMIQEHVLELQSGKAKDACLLADWKKADAVLVPKRVTNTLEGLFRDDPTDDLLRHCLASPLWLVEGTVDVSHAAICITNEEASLRAADHAAFMLAGTGTRITLLHVAKTLSHPVSTPAAHITAELEKWLMTPEGRPVKPFLHQAHDILKREGIGDERVRITVIPSQGKAALEIPAFCQKERIGIVVLGHTPPKGVTGFLKGSVTKKIIADLKNMAVWVNQ